MNEHLERRVVAFIRALAMRCRECLRRYPENCERCDLRPVRHLLREIEADRAIPQKDYSLYTRMALIAELLKHSRKPLLSSEIRLDGLCSNQLKQWTLKRMERMGIVGRELAFTASTGYRVYRYFHKDDRQEKRT